MRLRARRRGLKIPWFRKPKLTPEEADAIRAGRLVACRFCGGYHNFHCPYIQEVEYDGDARIKRVRFDPSFLSMVDNIVWDSDLPEGAKDDSGDE